jgi:hypothetical protein
MPSIDDLLNETFIVVSELARRRKDEGETGEIMKEKSRSTFDLAARWSWTWVSMECVMELKLRISSSHFLMISFFVAIAERNDCGRSVV